MFDRTRFEEVVQSMYVGAESTLVVRSALGSNEVYPDPENIIVGFSSDLTLQIQCLSVAETEGEIVTWQYQNRSEVPMGLQAFGVSQDVDGVLRVHPVSELMDKNLFLCSNKNGTNLNVTFSLGECILMVLYTLKLSTYLCHIMQLKVYFSLLLLRPLMLPFLISLKLTKQLSLWARPPFTILWHQKGVCIAVQISQASSQFINQFSCSCVSD